MVKIIDNNRAIDSFYLHYTDENGSEVYEFVRLNEHRDLELDLKWESFEETQIDASENKTETV